MLDTFCFYLKEGTHFASLFYNGYISCIRLKLSNKLLVKTHHLAFFKVLYIIPIMDGVNITIDTNVLIGALKSSKGASYKLLMLLTEDLFVTNVSVPLFIEYESVAKRAGLIANLTEEDIEIILNYFLSKSTIHKIFYLWRPLLKDQKDDLVLEVAVKSQSKYIITFNKKDFKVSEKFGIEVLTPYEFLKVRGLLS